MLDQKEVVPAATAADVLRRARELAARGELRRLIAYVTDENRRLRDAELEYRLVRWRHEAFDDRSIGGRSDWPPSVPDLFAGEGLPEISADKLDAETLAAGIVHHGCLVVRGLVSAEAAQELVRGIDCVFEAADAARARAPLHKTLPWYAPFRVKNDNDALERARVWGQRGKGLFAADSPRMLFELVDLFDRAHIIDLIQTFLGERPTLSAQKATLRRVPPTTGTDWHQDGAFMGRDLRAVNVWLALSECGVDAPGLDLVPRRIPEVVETGTDVAKFDWSVDPGRVEIAARGTPVASPVFRPGDAVLFDHLCLHRTGVRAGMTKSRWAIESWFFGPSSPPNLYYPLVI